jgi:hypothetical protein
LPEHDSALTPKTTRASPRAAVVFLSRNPIVG